MIWVAWRQARGAMLGLAALVGGYGLLATFERHHPKLTGVTTSFSPYLFVFIALLLGAPLVSREFEHGTHQFAWTQSVTSRRWLAVRLAHSGAIALSAVALLHLVLNWILPYPPAPDATPGSAYFLHHGVLPYAIALFTVASGTLCGMLLRRLVPTLGVTLVVVVVVIGILSVIKGGSGWSARFWPMQFAEAGGLLAVTAVLVLVSLRLLRRAA